MWIFGLFFVFFNCHTWRVLLHHCYHVIKSSCLDFDQLVLGEIDKPKQTTGTAEENNLPEEPWAGGKMWIFVTFGVEAKRNGSNIFGAPRSWHHIFLNCERTNMQAKIGGYQMFDRVKSTQKRGQCIINCWRNSINASRLLQTTLTKCFPPPETLPHEITSCRLQMQEVVSDRDMHYKTLCKPKTVSKQNTCTVRVGVHYTDP